MTAPEQPPIEYELLRPVTLAEIGVTNTQINSTSNDDSNISSHKHKR
jgi:hypothetical protein